MTPEPGTVYAMLANRASGPVGCLADTLALQAWMDKELEEIAAQQHTLTRRRAILRDLATRLRFGTPVVVVLAHLEAAQ